MRRILLAALALGLLFAVAARAEYGDVVLNDRSETGGMRPVIFPHWLHRTKFKCQVCHTDLGFKMEVGANRISMADVYYGRYCGACHDGNVSFAIEDNCGRCHSGRKGVPTGIHGRHRTTGPEHW